MNIESTYDVPDTYVVFDLETTGLSPENGEIIEIGAIRMKNGLQYSRFHSYVKPVCGIPLRITALTGITPSDVKDAPGIETALPRFAEFVGSDTLIAHNAPFDCRFVRAYGAATGVELHNTVIDSLRLARKFVPIQKHKLEILKDYFGITVASHNALDDCHVTAHLVEFCRKRRLEAKA